MATRLQGTAIRSTDVAFSIAQQESLGVIPSTGWVELPVKSISSFGAVTEKSTDELLGQSRAPDKPSITGLTSPFGFEAYVTLDGFRKYGAAMLYTRLINGDVTGLKGVSLTATTVTLDKALGTTEITRFKAGSLVRLQGTLDSDNDKVAMVTTNATLGKTLTFAANTFTPAPNDDFELSFAGYRKTSNTPVTWDYSATRKTLTLTLAGIGTTLEGLDLMPGQKVHFGSLNDDEDGYENGPVASGGNTVLYGVARVLRISAGSIIFDQVDETLQGNPAASYTGTLDILFGTFARDVPGGSDDFCEYAYSIEQAIAGLGDGTPNNVDTSYEYTFNQYPNTLSHGHTIGESASASFGFSGTDTFVPTIRRRPGPAAARKPIGSKSFSTVADFGRLVINGVDETGLTTDFKSMTLNVNNNVTGENTLASLGPKFQNIGQLNITLDAQVLFTSPAVIRAIRNNETVGFITNMRNEDGVIFTDIPSSTIDGGGREYPANQAILISTVLTSYKDDRFGDATLMLSTIPVYLPDLSDDE